MIQQRVEDAKKIHHQASHIIYFFLSLVVENKIKHLIKYLKKNEMFSQLAYNHLFIYTKNPHDFQTCIYFMCAMHTTRRRDARVHKLTQCFVDIPHICRIYIC